MRRIRLTLVPLELPLRVEGGCACLVVDVLVEEVLGARPNGLSVENALHVWLDVDKLAVHLISHRVYQCLYLVESLL